MRFHVRWNQVRALGMAFALGLIAVAGSAGARWH
jgi:hypothetical protein